MAGKKYYIGLACTFHDPAIAVLDENGTILFAEATERSLQCKKASGIVCDEINNTKKLLRQYCADGEEFIISYSWSKSYLNKLLFQYFTGILRFKEWVLQLLFKGIDSNTLTSYDLVGLEYLQLSSVNQAGNSFIKTLKSVFPNCTIKKRYYPHHLTHAAYACYTSSFDEGTCVVMDGYGEKGSFSVYTYSNNIINTKFEQRNLASLGFIYALITRLCGFDSFNGEQWKIMGLAPYGKLDKSCYDLLKSMVKVKGHSFKFTLFRPWLNALRELSKRHCNKKQSFKQIADLAYTGQLFFSEVLGELLKNTYKINRSQNLIFTGGCALNSSFNGQIVEKTDYKRLYIPPAPGDDGNALGAALLSFYKEYGHKKSLHQNHSPYLGSSVSDDVLSKFLKFSGIRDIRYCPKDICEQTASLLVEGKLIGWVQGRSEFGPRALGNRSILADPRSADMKDRINSYAKFREGFRPFAPSILHECGPEYFEDYDESPFMERTLFFKKEVLHKVPAVVHVDNSGRLQSVKKELNPRFYNLIQSFYLKTGVPLLLNTSFNTMGKPIIHSVEDAIGIFYTSGLDALVIEDYIICK